MKMKEKDKKDELTRLLQEKEDEIRKELEKEKRKKLMQKRKEVFQNQSNDCEPMDQLLLVEDIGSDMEEDLGPVETDSDTEDTDDDDEEEEEDGVQIVPPKAINIRLSLIHI